jgi:HEAT repeat protein
MLNRLGTLVWESGGLPMVIDLMDQGTVDRQLLASVLRTSGKEGEELLIKLMKYHSNEKVRSSAASVMAYRLPEDSLKLDIEIEIV